MTDNRRYIIIANDSNNRIWAYGSPVNNRPFTSEEAAERRKRAMQRESRDFSFLVVPLSTMRPGGGFTQEVRHDA